MLIIVPTNSLLEELYIKLIDNNKTFQMNYCISTQPYFRRGLRNFLIITPERFLLLYEGCDLSSFDIIIMDETYKIVDSRNEHISDFIEARSVRFRKVADIIGQTNNRLILLSPFTYELTDSMERYFRAAWRTASAAPQPRSKSPAHPPRGRARAPAAQSET